MDTDYSLLETSCENRVVVNTQDGNQPSNPPPGSIINPCGLIAWSVFNDSFELRNQSVTINMTSSGIAWPSDKSMKFKNQQPSINNGVVVRNGTTGQNFPPFYHWLQQSCDNLPAEINTTANVLLCRQTSAGWCFSGSGRLHAPVQTPLSTPPLSPPRSHY